MRLPSRDGWKGSVAPLRPVPHRQRLLSTSSISVSETATWRHTFLEGASSPWSRHFKRLWNLVVSSSSSALERQCHRNEAASIASVQPARPPFQIQKTTTKLLPIRRSQERGRPARFASSGSSVIDIESTDGRHRGLQPVQGVGRGRSGHLLPSTRSLFRQSRRGTRRKIVNGSSPAFPELQVLWPPVAARRPPAGTKNGSAFDERNRNNIDQSCSVIYSFTKKFLSTWLFLPCFTLSYVWISTTTNCVFRNSSCTTIKCDTSCVVSSYHFNYLNFGRYLSCFYSRTCTGKEGLVYPIFSPATNVNPNVNKLSFVLPVARLRICLWSRLALSVANFLVRASAKHHVY